MALVRSAPGRTRTCDPPLRRRPLYPTELQGRGFHPHDEDFASGAGSSRLLPYASQMITFSAGRRPVGPWYVQW
jgi:hypothetical protein